MKKQILIAIALMIPATGFARVADFNALITDNMKAQGELHSTVTENIKETRKNVANAKPRERIVIVEKSQESMVSPTSKSFLAFKKESKEYRANETLQFDRLAAEIDNELAN